MEYQNILVEIEGQLAVVHVNRPDQLSVAAITSIAGRRGHHAAGRWSQGNILPKQAATVITTKPTPKAPAKSPIWINVVQRYCVWPRLAMVIPVIICARASSSPIQTTGAATTTGTRSRWTATRDKPTNTGR